MIQFFLKDEPSNQFKHIVVAIPRIAVVCGFGCFEANETDTYDGERFDFPESPDVAKLVPMKITGKELRSQYEIYDPEGHVSFSWK